MKLFSFNKTFSFMESQSWKACSWQKSVEKEFKRARIFLFRLMAQNEVISLSFRLKLFDAVCECSEQLTVFCHVLFLFARPLQPLCTKLLQFVSSFNNAQLTPRENGREKCSETAVALPLNEKIHYFNCVVCVHMCCNYFYRIFNVTHVAR